MKKKDTSLYLVALLAVAILIGVGYAALSATLNITGQTTIEKASWDIHIGRISKFVKNGATLSTTPEAGEINAGNLFWGNIFPEDAIDNNTNTLLYTANLKKPGDICAICLEIKNMGTIDAKISEIIKNDITEAQKKYLNYSVTYFNGIDLAQNDIIVAGESKDVIIGLEFKTDDITAQDLPQEEQTINGNFEVTFVQAD